MDAAIIFLYQNLLYLVIFAGTLILAKFIAGYIYFKGNVVDSITKFFWFYSFSNIHMTESISGKMLKRVNNVANLLIYLLVFLLITIYYIHPDIREN
jgi:hypothetical protein